MELELTELDSECVDVQVRLDTLPLKLTVRLPLRLTECVTLPLPDLEKLAVCVHEPVPDGVLLPDGLNVLLKLRLALHDPELVELSDELFVVLSDGCRVEVAVKEIVLVLDSEVVAVNVVVAGRLLERLPVRLLVAEDAVGLSLVLGLRDNVAEPETVALRLRVAVDGVDVPDSDAEVVTLPENVPEKLPLKLLLLEALDVPETLTEALPDWLRLRDRVPDLVAEHVAVPEPETDALHEGVSDGLAVTLRLLVHVPVRLTLPDGEPVLEGVVVSDPDLLTLHEAEPLPDLVTDRLVAEKLSDGVLESESEVLSVTEPVKLKLLLADDV